MSEQFEQVLEQVQQLNRWEQLALIESIAQRLGEDESTVIPESVIQENNRRLAAYDAGETKGIPYAEAMQSIRQEIAGQG